MTSAHQLQLLISDIVLDYDKMVHDFMHYICLKGL